MGLLKPCRQYTYSGFCPSLSKDLTPKFCERSRFCAALPHRICSSHKKIQRLSRCVWEYYPYGLKSIHISFSSMYCQYCDVVPWGVSVVTALAGVET